jgi:hypothetical protein
MAQQLTKQQQYLLERLPKWWSSSKPTAPAKPKEVRAAEVLVARFERMVERKEKSYRKGWEKAMRVARDAIYFKDSKAALKAVEAFERKYPQN